MSAKPHFIVLLYLIFITGLIAQGMVAAPAATWWFIGIFLFTFGPIFFGPMQGAQNLALAFAGFALVGLALTGFLGWQAQQEAAWPAVPGVITRQWNCTRRTNGEVTYSGPCVDYEYTLAETQYTGSSIDTEELSGYAFLWETLGVPPAFQEGNTIMVHYDPAHPTDPLYTRILPGLRLRHQIGFLAGGLLFFMALVGAAYAAWQGRATRPALPSVVQ